MPKQIFTYIILIIIGALIALFIFISWQFHQRLFQLENLSVQSEQKIAAIEDWLNKNFTSKNSDNNQGADNK